MNAPQDFNTMLQQQLDHQETKARLTKAEKLLLTCDTVIKTMSRQLSQRNTALSVESDRLAEAKTKLHRIPLWIRRIFNAH